MRLVRLEIDKRIDIKLDKSISEFGGIMKYGENNDYPQIIERLIQGSTTAKAAANTYANFLTGFGFNDPDLNGIKIGKDYRGKDITMLSLLRQTAQALAFFNGVFIHVDISLERKIKSAKIVPFKNCRFSKKDDKGYCAKVAVYENWEKEKGQDYKAGNVKFYNTFNLDPTVFASQVKQDGGVKSFRGQVYFMFLDNNYLYPLSPIDQVYMDADTEFQIQLFKNRQIRNGFLNKTVFRVAEPSNESDAEDLKESIKGFIGPDGDSVLILTDEFDENGEIKPNGAFKIDKIETNVNDKLFENWEKNLANNIRKAYKALPAILIDYEESKLGTTSGEAIIQATNYYNSQTESDRTAISEMFKEIFSNFDNEQLRNVTDWTIKKIDLYGKSIELGGTTGN